MCRIHVIFVTRSILGGFRIIPFHPKYFIVSHRSILMSTFTNFVIHQGYASFAALGDRLGEIQGLIDRGAFRPLLADLYTNDTEKGGRPNYDVVLMIRMLVLQQWYGLSDPELERQATDRISFRHFLGYPEMIPDRSTIWLFRERLAQTGKDTVIWEEFQRQLEAKGLTIKRGVIQDTTFVTADPGHAPADTPRGDRTRTRRSRGGTWVKKGSKSQFGYKLHILVDKDCQLIHRIETTTASLHDSRIDLSRKGETVRDKGYFGVKPRASMDKTMHHAVRGRPLSIVARVRVKNTFSRINFDLRQLLTLQRRPA